MKQQFILPKEIELPPIDIPILFFMYKSKKYVKVGVAVQTTYKNGNFSFQPKLKGHFSRNNFDVKYSYIPCTESGRLKHIELQVTQTL